MDPIGAKEVRLNSGILRDVRMALVEPGLVSCDFKVPYYLLDKIGFLAPAAATNLVKDVGAMCCIMNFAGIHPRSIVTVDMSIFYLSTAKLGDELEIKAKLIGTKGNHSGTTIAIRNKVTGKLIIQGRVSMLHQQVNTQQISKL